MPNASLGQPAWGGINSPPPGSTPGLKQYPIEQVLYFHEINIQGLMKTVGSLQSDMSHNSTEKTNTNLAFDVNVIKQMIKDEFSTQLNTQNEKLQNNTKTIAALHKELTNLKKNNSNNVELSVEG